MGNAHAGSGQICLARCTGWRDRAIILERLLLDLLLWYHCCLVRSHILFLDTAAWRCSRRAPMVAMCSLRREARSTFADSNWGGYRINHYDANVALPGVDLL